MSYPNNRLPTRRSIKLLAPAKINIGLLITKKLPNGYHEIETLMVPIKLFDILQIEVTKSGVVLETDSNQIPPGNDNLVVKAAKYFLDAARINLGVKVFLKKRIPVGAGLGGGSSDAAYTLLGLNKIFNSPLGFPVLKEIANTVGKDVVFFLYQKPALVMGSGEIVKTVNIPSMDLALYVPPYQISTKWAYNEFDQKLLLIQSLNKLLTERDFYFKLICKKLKRKDFTDICALVINNFEPIVFMRYPDLLSIKLQLLANGAYWAGLSGSGSCVYAIINTKIKQELRSKINKELIFTETM
ncbi:MAG: 4-(cytidine 5'-diphospho)-2-C-methyl-D-erythritol kinase [candidate division WOR-3 bacterium]